MVKKSSSKKSKVTKKSTILGSFSSKFVDKIRSDFINSQTNPIETQSKKVYDITVPLGASSAIVDRIAGKKFYCTSLVIEYSLSGYLAAGGTSPINFVDTQRDGGGTWAFSPAYNRKTLSFGTPQPANQIQIICDPPLIFESQGDLVKQFPIIAVLLNSVYVLNGTDYLHVTLLGYETLI